MVVAPFVFVIFVPLINIMIMAAKRSDKNEGTRRKKREEIHEKKKSEEKKKTKKKQMSMTRKTYESISKKKKGRNTTVKAAQIPVHTYIFALLSLPSTILPLCPRFVILFCKLRKKKVFYQ